MFRVKYLLNKFVIIQSLRIKSKMYIVSGKNNFYFILFSLIHLFE